MSVPAQWLLEQQDVRQTPVAGIFAWIRIAEEKSAEEKCQQFNQEGLYEVVEIQPTF